MSDVKGKIGPVGPKGARGTMSGVHFDSDRVIVVDVKIIEAEGISGIKGITVDLTKEAVGGR